MENKLDFLYTAINDAQELIRFTDAKTGFAVTVIGAFIAYIISIGDNIIIYYKLFGNLTCFIFWMLIIAVAINMLIVIRILKPTNNPTDNIVIGENNNVKTLFYLAGNEYNDKLFALRNVKEHKLKIAYETYKADLTGVSDNDIVDTLILELLKVNFIRNIKMDRFEVLCKFILITIIIFILLVVLYTKDINYIRYLEYKCY